MSYIVRVEGMIIGVQKLTTEEVIKINKSTEISLEKVEK